MHAIEKSIVIDGAGHPVAVQIGYADWVEIERSLQLSGKEPGDLDPAGFAGVISLREDPLGFQNRLRGEWR